MFRKIDKYWTLCCFQQQCSIIYHAIVTHNALFWSPYKIVYDQSVVSQSVWWWWRRRQGTGFFLSLSLSCWTRFRLFPSELPCHIQVVFFWVAVAVFFCFCSFMEPRFVFGPWHPRFRRFETVRCIRGGENIPTPNPHSYGSGYLLLCVMRGCFRHRILWAVTPSNVICRLCSAEKSRVSIFRVDTPWIWLVN